MKYKTFEDWKKAGYTILAGSKHTHRNKKGNCLFSEGQVIRSEYKNSPYTEKNWPNNKNRLRAIDYDPYFDDPTMWNDFGNI